MEDTKCSTETLFTEFVLSRVLHGREGERKDIKERRIGLFIRPAYSTMLRPRSLYSGRNIHEERGIVRVVFGHWIRKPMSETW